MLGLFVFQHVHELAALYLEAKRWQQEEAAGNECASWTANMAIEVLDLTVRKAQQVSSDSAKRGSSEASRCYGLVIGETMVLITVLAPSCGGEPLLMVSMRRHSPDATMPRFRSALERRAGQHAKRTLKMSDGRREKGMAPRQYRASWHLLLWPS